MPNIIKRIDDMVYSEDIILSDHGLETYIQISPNIMF